MTNLEIYSTCRSFAAAAHTWRSGSSDLSRMKGNFHVRFLEGGGLATARSYSTLPRITSGAT